MKKYVKLLPLILYPYAYLLWIIFMVVTQDTVIEEISEQMDLGMGIYGIIFVVYNIYVIFISIYHAVTTARNDSPAKEAARTNLVIKSVQIPAYIFHFIMGVIGFCMGIWGIGFLLVAVLVDVLTISFTGISAIGCGIKMKKEGHMSTGAAVVASIGSFLFCIDIFVALFYVVKSRKKN